VSHNTVEPRQFEKIDTEVVSNYRKAQTTWISPDFGIHYYEALRHIKRITITKHTKRKRLNETTVIPKRHVSTREIYTSAEFCTNIEKTSTTAHQLGRNGISNNRDLENRDCTATHLLDEY
jgi:hypothetical protein